MGVLKCSSEAILLRLSDPEALRALGSELKSGPPSYYDHADHLWGAAERIENYAQIEKDIDDAEGAGAFKEMAAHYAKRRIALAEEKAAKEAELEAAAAARREEDAKQARLVALEEEQKQRDEELAKLRSELGMKAVPVDVAKAQAADAMKNDAPPNAPVVPMATNAPDVSVHVDVPKTDPAPAAEAPKE